MAARALLLAAALALSACGALGPDAVIERLYVDSATVECVGEAVQRCLRVKWTPEADWELLYDEIEGFEYEPGFTYVLEVEVRETPDPPADGSSVAYRLVRVVEKTPA